MLIGGLSFLWMLIGLPGVRIFQWYFRSINILFLEKFPVVVCSIQKFPVLICSIQTVHTRVASTGYSINFGFRYDRSIFTCHT